jgi:RNA polymerase sigma-70 factor (ECF subfamily)
MEFEEIYKTYWQRSISVEGMSMTTIGQKTSSGYLLTVWKKLDTFRKESAISTWIYRIAVNNSSSNRKKRLPKSNLPDYISESIEIPIDSKISFYISVLMI